MQACKRHRFALLALLALLAPMLARADFADDYIAGLAALDHGEYTQAVESLQRAVDAHPNPAPRVMIEGNPQPYLPHHFLGMAQLKLGHCAAAEKEWGSAMNLRMLGRFYQIRQQEQQLLAQCKPGTAVVREKSATPASAQNAESGATSQSSASAVPSPTPANPATVTAAHQTAAAAQAGPPARLVRAFNDYVGARYTAVTHLDPAAFADHRARFQAYLLRAAARFALVRLGDDKTLLDAARRDAHAALALEKTAPDATVFSPDFRAFYASAK